MAASLALRTVSLATCTTCARAAPLSAKHVRTALFHTHCPVAARVKGGRAVKTVDIATPSTGVSMEELKRQFERQQSLGQTSATDPAVPSAHSGGDPWAKQAEKPPSESSPSAGAAEDVGETGDVAAGGGRGRRRTRDLLRQLQVMKDAAEAAAAEEAVAELPPPPEAAARTQRGPPKHVAATIHSERQRGNIERMQKKYGVPASDFTAEGVPLGERQRLEEERRRATQQRYEDAERLAEAISRATPESDADFGAFERRTREMMDEEIDVNVRAKLAEASLKLKMLAEAKKKTKAPRHSSFSPVDPNAPHRDDYAVEVRVVTRSAMSELIARAQAKAHGRKRKQSREAPKPNNTITALPPGVRVDDLEEEVTRFFSGSDVDSASETSFFNVIEHRLSARVSAAMRKNPPTPEMSAAAREADAAQYEESMKALMASSRSSRRGGKGALDREDEDGGDLDLEDEPQKGSGEGKRMSRKMGHVHEESEEFQEWVQMRKAQLRLQKPGKYLNDAVSRIGLGPLALTNKQKRDILKETKSDVAAYAKATFGKLKLPKVPRVGTRGSVRVLQVQTEYHKAVMKCFLNDAKLDSSLLPIRRALVNASLNITKAEMSRDLAVCQVFYVHDHNDKLRAMGDLLDRSASWLRFAVQDIVKMKYAPEIRFVLDESDDKVAKIDALIGIARQRDELAGEGLTGTDAVER